MRKVAPVMLATLVLAIALPVSPAAAAAAVTCSTQTGTITFSPPLPIFGDPSTVNPTVTGTETLSGCAGLRIAGGTMAFTGTAGGPYNCDKALGGHGSFGGRGTETVTWSNGQTSTLAPFFPVSDNSVTSGLFTGATTSGPLSMNVGPPGRCTTTPLASATFTILQPLKLTLAAGTASCTSPQSCQTNRSASATVQSPGLTVTVTGSPAVGIGTVFVKIASGKMPCPTAPTTAAPIATLTDTGFAPTDRLLVTATLPLTSPTSAEQVCFDSTKPFKSQSSPTVAAPGPALLLACTKVANVAPCVLSSSQVGSDAVVKFVVPGGDPRFYIVLPRGRQIWLSHYASGKVGTAYRAQFQTSGGRAPVRWSIASGTLPGGCTLNTSTGTITGTPTAKGNFPVLVKATDGEKPPKTATISVPITIK